ncbi:MAG: hypothetical protein A3G71_05915 [Gammaproteobacteria bacterium RIFCSPLOWO2_12_FULL_38_14]|nr:MAG: hypothetical protein A3G71_05915 [Gammaproteobacteria bacterium RIFCSPLOWO2_12_FULL_38_14]
MMILNKKIFFVGFLFLVACASVHQNQESAECNMRLGLAYLTQGEIEHAYRKLQLAVTQAPSDPESLSAMAYYYEYLGENEKARRWYRRAISQAPGGKTYNNYAVFLCKQKEYQHAMRAFDEAFKDPNYLTYKTYRNAGFCAYSFHDLATAQPLLQKALKYYPNDEEIRKLLF